MIFRLIFGFLLWTNLFHAQVIERDLSRENWFFSVSTKQDFLKATVPGTVHTDLLQNKRIEDPFWGDNEKKIQWIEQEDWVYKSSFWVTKTEINTINQELIFEGLDTYASVKLNGISILTADNMFRQWKVNVKDVLRLGKNDLEIVFFSAVKKGKEAAAKLPYVLPGDEKVFARKAQYQYGWDWGPRFVTAGIWKPITLKCWKNVSLENVAVQQKLSNEVAELDFQTEISSDQNQIIEIWINSTKKTFAIHKGITLLHVPYRINHPKLWWPNGLGDPTLYPFKIKIKQQNTLLEQKQLNLGLRTIELVQDKEAVGKSFYFKVNGVPVYMKGANVIPFHSFLPKVTSEAYQKMVQVAKDSHMNMLRVWGGGVYGDDAFYDACDANGILVWQDFMFACAMYPGDNNFVDNVKNEAEDQVKRLQNHPSLTLWCGNNENDEGWKNWGWQKQYQYTPQDSTTIWKHYEKVFYDVLPNVLNRVSVNKTIYWPSSPSIGWGHQESFAQGDSHYWGVWWGVEPVEKYKEKVGRFMSEYGLQGMPALETFKTFAKTDALNLNSGAVKNHQKHPNGTAYIQTYIERDFRVPTTFEKYIYVSQLQQALGIKTAIEAHRRAKPYNMGTLYWQLNDCWPVTSWSSIDFYGRKKALQYQVKESYAPVLLSVNQTETTWELFGCNDELKTYKGNFSLQLVSFKGEILWQKNLESKIPQNTSTKLYSQALSDFANFNLKEAYLSVKFLSGTHIAFERTHYFVKPKDLILEDTPLKFNITGENQLELLAPILKKNVYLYGEDCEFEDNFFDLYPNTTRKVYFKGNVENIKVLSLVDIP